MSDFPDDPPAFSPLTQPQLERHDPEPPCAVATLTEDLPGVLLLTGSKHSHLIIARHLQGRGQSYRGEGVRFVRFPVGLARVVASVYKPYRPRQYRGRGFALYPLPTGQYTGFCIARDRDVEYKAEGTHLRVRTLVSQEEVELLHAMSVQELRNQIPVLFPKLPHRASSPRQGSSSGEVSRAFVFPIGYTRRDAKA